MKIITANLMPFNYKTQDDEGGGGVELMQGVEIKEGGGDGLLGLFIRQRVRTAPMAKNKNRNFNGEIHPLIFTFLAELFIACHA